MYPLTAPFRWKISDRVTCRAEPGSVYEIRRRTVNEYSGGTVSLSYRVRWAAEGRINPRGHEVEFFDERDLDDLPGQSG